MNRLARYAAAAGVVVFMIALLGHAVRADVPQVPTGTWTAGGPFGQIPSDVASAVLPDGRLLVTGGSASDGQPVAAVAAGRDRDIEELAEPGERADRVEHVPLGQRQRLQRDRVAAALQERLGQRQRKV